MIAPSAEYGGIDGQKERGLAPGRGESCNRQIGSGADDTVDGLRIELRPRLVSERKRGLFDTDAADFVLPILIRSSSDESPYPEPLAIVGAGAS